MGAQARRATVCDRGQDGSRTTVAGLVPERAALAPALGLLPATLLGAGHGATRGHDPRQDPGVEDRRVRCAEGTSSRHGRTLRDCDPCAGSDLPALVSRADREKETTGMRIGVLYVATSPSGKKYIGITSVGVYERWSGHLKETRRGTKTPLNSAIKRYGGDAFELKVLAIADWDYLNELEAKAIVAFGTLWPRGYNLRTGGSQFSPHPESIAKQAAKMRGRKWSEDRKAAHSIAMSRPEVKALCAAPHIGRKASEETRAKMRASRNGRAPSRATMEAAWTANRGAKRSEETRERMRNAIRPPATDEARRKMSESARKSWKKRRVA